MHSSSTLWFIVNHACFRILLANNIYISQANVATHLKCDRIFNPVIITSLLLNVQLKELWNSICQSYKQQCIGFLFWPNYVFVVQMLMWCIYDSYVNKYIFSFTYVRCWGLLFSCCLQFVPPLQYKTSEQWWLEVIWTGLCCVVYNSCA